MRQRQLIRAWLVACAATGCGATSHLIAGGHLPHPLILALATSLAALLTLGVSQLKLSRSSLAAGVLSGQGLIHGLYSHAQPLSFAPAGGHMHGGHIADQLSVGSVPAESQSLAMWVGHMCAAVATYALLVYGDQMVALLCSLLGAAHKFFSRLHPRGFLPVKPYRPGFLRPGTLASTYHGRCRLIRGPPTFAIHPAL